MIIVSFNTCTAKWALYGGKSLLKKIYKSILI